MNNCQELIYCLCCKQKTEFSLDLGKQPLANEFHTKGEVNMLFPLQLNYCKSCFHCQLTHSVSPDLLFKNYKYVSGTSNTAKEFYKWNAGTIDSYFDKPGRVLDIGCNDGSQLNPFRDLGWDTYGVDPAENLYPLSKNQGHNVICDFWKYDVAEKLPIMNAINAQNVFAHTPYIDDFLQACKKVMDDNTSLFILTSQKDMITNGEFDTIYHEHVSFFNIKSMNVLTKRNGLVLNRVSEHSIHGKSYIFEIKLIRDNRIYNLDKDLEREEKLGLYNYQIYDKFRKNAENSIENLKTALAKYKEYKIIGFGASAKGQTLICYGDIQLDYIIDENPLKIGTYSPKLNIPIVSLDHFKEDKCKKILILILAWNFAEEIKRKVNLAKGEKEIVIIEKYFPNVIVSD